LPRDDLLVGSVCATDDDDDDDDDALPKGRFSCEEFLLLFTPRTKDDDV
jgi:hypothetical protein